MTFDRHQAAGYVSRHILSAVDRTLALGYGTSVTSVQRIRIDLNKAVVACALRTAIIECSGKEGAILAC